MNKGRIASVFLSFLMVVGMAGTALAAQSNTVRGITPTLITGTSNNASLCSVQYPGTNELKIDGLDASGQYTSDDSLLTVNYTRPSVTAPGNANSIDWAWVSGPDVIAVIVKDGVDGSNNYKYDGTSFSDDKFLTTPNDGAKGISNVKFCYGDGGETPDASPLVIDKDAAGTFDKKFTWTIDKSVSPSGTIYTNATTVTLNYTVVVTRDAGTVSNVKVTGDIDVTNPNGAAVDIDGVTDELDGVTGETCTVTGGGPQALPSGLTTFAYECDLGATVPAGPVDNVATVSWGEQTLSNDAFLAAGSDQVKVPVTFTGNEIDECVAVNDTWKGLLGSTVCATTEFKYTRWITVYPGCNVYRNVADFKTNDTWATGSDYATVTICQTNRDGFTMGYWQNKNGQADIASFFPSGTCAALKTTYYPNVLSGLNCASAATFQSSVKDIIKAADSSGDGVKMFKAQFLATALSVRKTASLGTTNVTVNGALFTPPTSNCISVNQLLAAANASFATLSLNKTNLLTVKDYFDRINNNIMVTCVPGP